jgi:DNA adenine methylase
MKPFLKWAGNKHRLLPRILPLLPKGQRLVEPFVGSGAVFLNTQYDDYLLADTNATLIRVYQLLQEEGEPFVAYARAFFTPENNSAEAYYENRAMFNATNNDRLKAALFLYLNRHGFNGLCRFNRKGDFNVPFGRYDKPYFPEAELYAFIEKAQTAQLTFAVQSFEATFAQAQRGDIFYCDPPYVPMSPTASFTSYAPNQFGLPEQQQLATLARDVCDKNIPVIISNHHTPLTVGLYQSAQINTFDVQRNISCLGDKRKKAAELLAVFESAG